MERLEVADAPLAAAAPTAHEDVTMITPRVGASITERGVLALRADLKRPPRTWKLIAAVSAQAKHGIYIGRPDPGTEGR